MTNNDFVEFLFFYLLTALILFNPVIVVFIPEFVLLR